MVLNMTSNIEKAKTLATKWHKGQTRKTGEDFITHPETVANMFIQNINNEVAICAAWLHDVLEDTPITREEMIKEMGKEVTDIVILLTHDPKEPYFDYIMRIKGNQIASSVKYCDLTHNISTWKSEGSLKEKWKLARYILRD